MTIIQHEIDKFTNIAKEWWDVSGSFKLLHEINPIRLEYVLSQIRMTNPDIKNLRILDVGCGGGILSMPLARLGAQVTGIDAGHENIEAAKAKASSEKLDVSFECCKIEDFVDGILGASNVIMRNPSMSSLRKQGSNQHSFEASLQGDSCLRRNDKNEKMDCHAALAMTEEDDISEKFDVVLCLEVLEHVENPEIFISYIAKTVKQGGLVILSTINRTLKAKLLAIGAAEYILGMVPRGTHDYDKLIKPSELKHYAAKNNLKLIDLKGMVFDLKSRDWVLSDDIDINYFASLRVT